MKGYTKILILTASVLTLIGCQPSERPTQSIPQTQESTALQEEIIWQQIETIYQAEEELDLAIQKLETMEF